MHCQTGCLDLPHASNGRPLGLGRKHFQADPALGVVGQVRVHETTEIVMCRVANAREVEALGLGESPAPVLVP